MSDNTIPIGIGYYTIPEAGRLTRIPSLNIRRWLGGYDYTHKGQIRHMGPLWKPQLPANNNHIELGFRDLIELRFVQAFLDAGLTLNTVRTCLDVAREYVGEERPFSTRKFRTDGRTIFLESVERAGEDQLLNLKKRQFEFKRLIERSYKDLDVNKDTVVSWRPFHGKPSIIVDPERAFGQPIVARFGVPTATIAQAVRAEGSVKAVARLFEVPTAAIRDAVAYEKTLLAA